MSWELERPLHRYVLQHNILIAFGTPRGGPFPVHPLLAGSWVSVVASSGLPATSLDAFLTP
jgi:hypothetical protein